jgi:hypothetical protein
MGKTVPSVGNAIPPAPASGRTGLDRFASFRITYIAIFCFLLLYVFSVEALEGMLSSHFQRAVREATRVDPHGPVREELQSAVERIVRDSAWVRIGGVRVTAVVLGADGTPIYVGERAIPAPSPELSPPDQQILPASTDVVVSVPHNSLAANGILVVYAALLIQTLFYYDRRRSRAEQERIREAVAARDETAARALHIERELVELSERMEERIEAEVAEEIHAVHGERLRLQEKLDALAQREEELRARSGEVQQTLHDEQRALEELLEESLADLARKNEELQEAEAKIKRASRGEARRGRDLEWAGRRLRTLYKNVEIDDNAVESLVELGDEGLRLRAEEAIKRLSDDLETASVRRKVGGLPSHLTIFELGFAGKGRIYYTTGRQRRFRILLIGAKNSQKTDLEYLSRLPKE